jgi:hypothetical protein
MTGSLPNATGRIFISYRREETAYPAGWLYDRLADRYGGRCAGAGTDQQRRHMGDLALLCAGRGAFLPG